MYFEFVLKKKIQVCINGKWPAFQAENMGSIPITCILLKVFFN